MTENFNEFVDIAIDNIFYEVETRLKILPKLYKIKLILGLMKKLNAYFQSKEFWEQKWDKT